MSEFKDELEEANKSLKVGEKLVVKEPVFEENTGEVLFNGAIYKVKNKCPDCNYRTSDNPVDANLQTEVQEGVSCADFSDYVDNRDIIRALMAHSERSQLSLRRFVNDMTKEDGLDEDYLDEDYDVDALDDLEMLTAQHDVLQAYEDLQNQSSSKQAETTDDEKERSDDEKEGVDASVE